jgi:hypothetical protein
MEWADDDWDDDYHVIHDYGDAVCRDGNCWHGGGYYGGRGDLSVDRGDITRNRNVNISGNEITINREGTFSQNQLAALRQPAGWVPDTRHRRGQAYPAAAQERLGKIQQPALAGHRLGATAALPEAARGFAPAAERRPSSAEIQERLERGRRDNALEGLRASGQDARIESRRGTESRRKAAASDTREIRSRQQPVQPLREPRAGQRPDRQRIEPTRQPPSQDRAQALERQAAPPPQRARSPDLERDRAQRVDRQRRSEIARPNAFEGAGDALRTQNFSQRGAASRERMAVGGDRRTFGGGGRRR